MRWEGVQGDGCFRVRQKDFWSTNSGLHFILEELKDANTISMLRLSKVFSRLFIR